VNASVFEIRACLPEDRRDVMRVCRFRLVSGRFDQPFDFYSRQSAMLERIDAMRARVRARVPNPLDSGKVHSSGYTLFLITVSEWRYIIIRVP